MSFDRDVAAWVEKVKRNAKSIHLNTVSEVQNGIQDGSAITGAPGQPVDTGNLRASWTVEHESDLQALVFTNVAYAESIEEGQQKSYKHYISGKTVVPRPIVFKSAVGGAHSVALTRAGWAALVDAVVKDTVGE